MALLAQTYMKVAVWHLLPAFLFVVLRSLISAHGNTSVLLLITLIAIVINAIGNYALIFGNLGMPRLELTGAGISTTVVNTFMFLCALLYVLKHKRHKRYAILVRLYKPDWHSFFNILRIGTPVGLMITAETGLFTAATVMMGWLGTDQLAGHAVAVNMAAMAFMVPLGLSFATTIRVGLAYGRGSHADIATAGWVSIQLAIVLMSCSLTLFLLFPEYLVHLFLSPDIEKNSAPIAFAVKFLAVAALFQLVDGAQVAAAAALRGLNDTKIPMFIAIVGYWLIGIPVGYVLAFVFGLNGVGIWLGLAMGLAFVAVILIIRFARRNSFKIIKKVK